MVAQLRPPMSSRSPVRLRRLLRAVLASTATGVVVYFTVMHLALPTLAAKLSPHGREWLRQALATHPYWVMAAVVGLAAIAALPVLAMFRFVYGPRRE